MTHVHLVGIGGSGLSAIALVLLESGYTVSGSDQQLSPLARRVQAAGARVEAGHRAENIRGADLLVRSSAIGDDNVEVQAARAAGIPVYKRADYLGQLMHGRQAIAVAGTHGKTTTTAMLAWMLAALGTDPSYIIGGVSANLGANAHAGRGPFFVIEADEYDHMFLGLQPHLAVVTNVEYDHPDCYPTPQEFHQAFLDFAGRLQPGGVLVGCTDDPGAARLLAETARQGLPTVAYGLAERRGRAQPDYLAAHPRPNQAGGFSFELVRRSEQGSAQPPLAVALRVPGLHNVCNALAALAVADRLGLPLEQAGRALAAFAGTGRRFAILGEARGITIIDDYAHHPTEIRATLAAARARYPGRRIWAVWQPHTYSRTRTLFDAWLAAFQDAERVLVTEIYPAREAAPADGFSARQVVDALWHAEARFVPGLDEARAILLAELAEGDVVLVLSAGDAERLSAQVLQALQAPPG